MSSNRRLRELARELPESQLFRNGKPVTITVMESGADILKKDPKAPVNPDFKYKVLYPQYRNHEKELIAAWKKYGQEGVDAYCAVIHEQHRMAQVKEMEKLPWWKQLWVAIKERIKSL